MSDLEKAYTAQLANLQTRTGKTLEELGAIVAASGLSKHGELVAMLKATLGMGHGDANTLVHFLRKPGGLGAPSDLPAASLLDALYLGPKAALRPIHEALLPALEGLGPFEVAPKKTYLSYRRQKQFAMIGPATNTRVEVGLNMKGVEATDRLQALPPGQMCNYKVKVTGVEQVDEELIAWIRQAYASAG